MRNTLLVLMLFGALAVTGCSSMRAKNDGGSAAADAQGASTRGAHLGGGGPDAAPGTPLAQHVYYFDYDSADISPADRASLMAHAKYLAAHPKVRVFIQGNADERGTHEYNLALGERRAKAVQQLLAILGAAKNRTDAISLGQEQPVAFCHDESCWHLNRRVELVYPDH